MSEKRTHASTITTFLQKRGTFGATDVEGANETGIKEHVYRAARGALEKKGIVGTLGERREDGRKRLGRVYLHANHVPAEVLAAAARDRETRADAKREAADKAQAASGLEQPHHGHDDLLA